jgi:NADH-quinone oxidoreductase subunit C
VSDSQSEPPAPSQTARWAALIGSESWSDAFRTPKVKVAPERWLTAHRVLKSALPFFSWLSAIDWASEVAIGDPPDTTDLIPRFEVLSRLSDVSTGAGVVLSADLPRENPRIDSLTGIYPGADWHEREAAEMFGINFVGHPNLVGLYLPDGFVGRPLLKSFPLLGREVKQWPGSVSVEALPGAAEGGDDQA